MNWKNTLRATGLVLALSCSLVGCNTESGYTPQEVINQALQETNDSMSYYGEYVMDIEEENTKVQVKEWFKEGKRRVELTDNKGDQTISVYDGSQLIMYDLQANTVQKMSFGDNEPNYLPSPKEQADILLNLMKESHEVDIVGEETVAGRATFHIKAKAKKEDTLVGDMEAWIDKKTWLTLKATIKSGGSKTTTEYTKFDADAKIEDENFTLDFPADATVIDFNEEDFMPQQATLNEAKQALGEFLIVPTTETTTLAGIYNMNVKDRPEFSFEYVQKEEPLFSISIFKTQQATEPFDLLPGEKEMDVRGQKGTQMLVGELVMLSWQENGYQYNIMSENPEVTVDDLLAYAQQMQPVE